MEYQEVDILSSFVDRLLGLFRGSKKEKEPEEDEVYEAEREEEYADEHVDEEVQAPEPSRVYG
jgi:hypothetical protein